MTKMAGMQVRPIGDVSDIKPHCPYNTTREYEDGISAISIILIRVNLRKVWPTRTSIHKEQNLPYRC